jgi:hypothetical protein
VFLKLTAASEVLLEDRDNFLAFKLLVEADHARLARCNARLPTRRAA